MRVVQHGGRVRILIRELGRTLEDIGFVANVINVLPEKW